LEIAVFCIALKFDSVITITQKEKKNREKIFLSENSYENQAPRNKIVAHFSPVSSKISLL